MTHAMPRSPAELAAQYVDLWNDRDPASRRVRIERLFTAQARYVDPLVASAGHDELDSIIAAAQERFTGLRFEVAGRQDAHHDVVRFCWALGRGDTEPLACGTDIAMLAPDGRIGSITGFLDKMPS